MPIQFNEIVDSLVPYMQAEIDSSMAVQGPQALPYRALLIGSATDAGSKAAKELVMVTDPDQAADYWGRGSQLHRMAAGVLKNFGLSAIYGIATINDALASAADKAIGSVVFTAVSAKAGTIALYIGGQRVAVSISDSDTAAKISSAVADAITDDFEVKADGTTTPGTLALTAKQTGAAGAKIDIRLNFHAGEKLPEGVTVVINAMTTSATNPDITDTLDKVGEEWFQVVACSYTDTTNLALIDAEFERKSKAAVGIDGVVFVADNGSFSDMTTMGDVDSDGLNSKHLCIIPTYGIPNSPWEIAGMAAGRVLSALRAGNGAESMPFTTLELVGALPPATTDRFIFAERQTLLESGVSTLKVSPGGKVLIERLVTNYQQNANGGTDPSWRNVNYRFTAMYLRWDWIYGVLYMKYSRAKLAGDDARIGAGQVVMTPSVGKAEALSRFRQWENLGLVENYDQFKADLIAERNAQNVDRMDWMLAPNFVNQFYNGATKIAFRL